jgi:hypothetical protein
VTEAELFRTAFARSMEPGRDAIPQAAARPAADGDAISEMSRRLFTGGLQRIALPDIPLLPVPTSARSPWYRRRCAECRHTFRVGDPAATCPRCGRVYHWNPIQGLDCLGVVFDNEAGRCICRGERILEPPPIPADLVAAEPMGAFVGGLAREYSAYGGQRPVVVTPELEGLLCAVCGHTVRLRELVVHCPCGNGPGGLCPAVIHLDFARQLHCWNDWHGGRGKSYCPLTGHELRSGAGG